MLKSKTLWAVAIIAALTGGVVMAGFTMDDLSALGQIASLITQVWGG